VPGRYGRPLRGRPSRSPGPEAAGAFRARVRSARRRPPGAGKASPVCGALRPGTPDGDFTLP